MRNSRQPESDNTEAGGKRRGSQSDPLAIAYAYLNRRERTVAEIRARLQRAEASEESIEAVVAELQELGCLDDARYARVFTEDKRNLEGWGRERIALALRDHGVDHDLITAAVSASVPGQELHRALGILAQRFPAGPQEPRDRNRAFGVLARKGYDSETAGDAVRAWARGERAA